MTDRLSDLLTRTARLIAGDGHSAGLKPVQWQALRYLAVANRFSRTPGAPTICAPPGTGCTHVLAR